MASCNNISYLHWWYDLNNTTKVCLLKKYKFLDMPLTEAILEYLYKSAMDDINIARTYWYKLPKTFKDYIYNICYPESKFIPDGFQLMFMYDLVHKLDLNKLLSIIITNNLNK